MTDPQPLRRDVLGGAALAALAAALSTGLSASGCGTDGAGAPDSDGGGSADSAGWSAARSVTFGGYGAWWDVYDWAPSMNPQGPPVMTAADTSRLVDIGVDALYIQTAHRAVEQDLLDEEILRDLINSAQADGLRVISWYLPEHLDTDLDFRRLAAPVALGVDGIGIDLESDAEKDITARNDRAVAVAEALRTAHPDMPMTAIVNPPVLYDELNQIWWPRFPWEALGGYFDAWMPMAYWSLRNGKWADPKRYVSENVKRVRSHVGDENLPVHALGGLAEATDVASVRAMGEAMRETDCIGGSLYDDRTTDPVLYGVMLQEFGDR